ncbi:MAG: glycosyltransferase family 4 protein [Deltaproteobacteria bacterium]|nr:glycosyltransferase family 4 protein [Deltaproteobacteria bacterium]
MPPPLHIALLDYRDINHPEAGGAEIYLNEIFQRIAAAGHRVTLLCARYGEAPAEDRIGEIRVLRTGNQATANFMVARAALRLARREPVDLFVENLCKLPFLMPLLTRAPVLPVVLHLFGHTIFQETNPILGSYVWLYEKLIPPVYRGGPVVALSPSTADDLARRGLERTRIAIVHPGLDLKRYHPSVTVPRSSEPLLLLVGRLKRYKGIDTVLRGFAAIQGRVPRARLVLLGRGDDEGRLRALAASLGAADRVSFEGYVDEDTKIDWLRRAHALVYSSPREGWGISALEAASCATPVLASDAEGLRDAVRHGVTGFLIPHDDAGCWADRMVEVLTDAPLRERMGAAGVEWAQRFDWDMEAGKMLAIVEEAAAGRGREPVKP